MLGHALLSELPLPMGESEPPSNTRFLGSTRLSIPNGISIGSPFSRLCTAHGSPILYIQWAAPFSHNCLPMGIWNGSLGPPESSTQTVSRSVQPFCTAHYCDRPTERQTMHATRSVTIGRMYVRSSLLRCGLIITRSTGQIYTVSTYLLQFTVYLHQKNGNV